MIKTLDPVTYAVSSETFTETVSTMEYTAHGLPDCY